MAECDYYDITIQEVSDRIGIMQAGLLKYIKNKNGLLMLVLRRYEDSSEAGDYIQSRLALMLKQREFPPLLMSEYCQTIVEDTMKRLQPMRLHLALHVEAIDSNHPVYEYCARRGERLCTQIGSCPWKLPPEHNTPQKIGLLSMCIDSAMEGL